MHSNLAYILGGSTLGGSTLGFLPTAINGCVLWLRSDLAWQDAAKTVPCTNESLIYTGEDKSLHVDAIQATEGNRPKYLTNQFNGHPAWSFTAAPATYLVVAGGNFVQPNTWFIVAKYDGAPNSHLLDGISSRELIGVVGAYMVLYAGTVLTGGLHDQNLHSFTAVFSGIASEMFIDGSPVGSGNSGTSGMTDAIIGAGSGFSAINGRIAEVICYDSVLSPADRQRVELYLNTEAQGTGYAIY